MYSTNLSLSGLIDWFYKSEFEYLMFFIASPGENEDMIEDIIRKQSDLDYITGEKIAFILFDRNLQDGTIFSVRGKKIEPCTVSCSYSTAEDVCKHFGVDFYRLPALFILNKTGYFKFYPLNDKNNLNLYFSIIGIVKSFKSDMTRLQAKVNHIDSLSSSIKVSKRIIEDLTKRRDKLLKLKQEYDNIPRRSEELAQRIENRYKSLLKVFKTEGYKQNFFENLFNDSTGHISRDYVFANIENDNILTLYANEIDLFIDDLNKLIFFKGFNSRLGKVSKQISQIIGSYTDEIEKLDRDINTKMSDLSRFQCEYEANQKKPLSYNFEMNNLLGVYAEKISRYIKTSNTKSILKALWEEKDANSLVSLLDLITSSSETNRVIAQLRERLKKKAFDVFISCKKQDYLKAHDLFNLLLKNGFNPFKADISLREMALDNYGTLIREVISNCKFMIVYASDLSYLTSSYVFSEWNQFLDDINSGFIEGKIFSIIPGDANPIDLPPGLRNRQYFSTEDYEDVIQFMRL